MSSNQRREDFKLARLAETSLTADDIDDVMNIERHSFNPPWSKSMFMEELANPGSVCMVFRFDHKVVAFELFWILLDEAHLMNIAVIPDFRRLGIGEHMMKRLEETCVQKGVRRILLDVARRNEPARLLYRKSGFSSVGFRKRYYPAINDDAIVMEKWLSQNLKHV